MLDKEKLLQDIDSDINGLLNQLSNTKIGGKIELFRQLKEVIESGKYNFKSKPKKYKKTQSSIKDEGKKTEKKLPVRKYKKSKNKNTINDAQISSN